jgi:hypothetical protein
MVVYQLPTCIGEIIISREKKKSRKTETLISLYARGCRIAPKKMRLKTKQRKRTLEISRHVSHNS